jgi:hypothetical protein
MTLDGQWHIFWGCLFCYYSIGKLPTAKTNIYVFLALGKPGEEQELVWSAQPADSVEK